VPSASIEPRELERIPDSGDDSVPTTDTYAPFTSSATKSPRGLGIESPLAGKSLSSTSPIASAISDSGASQIAVFDIGGLGIFAPVRVVGERLHPTTQTREFQVQWEDQSIATWLPTTHATFREHPQLLKTFRGVARATRASSRHLS
jgi:hypothetical protein